MCIVYADQAKPPPRPAELDHVGIAVADMDAMVALLHRTLGLQPASRERSDREMVEEVLLPVGGGYLQLLAATSPSSTIAKFLGRQGPGLHHLGLRVDDVEAALTAAEAAGARVLEPRLRDGSRGTRIGFLDPRTLSRVLIELVQPPTTSTSPDR